MAKTVADYPDAVKRIVGAEVPDDATTEAEVRAALAGAEGSQVTRDVADNVTDNVLTEERVRDAIENSGELPSENEISAIADASDDYDMGDRVAEVSDAVSDNVATVEDVEGAVDSVAETQEFVGADADDVVEQQAREVGAPTERDYRQAAVNAVSQDTVTPAEDPSIDSDNSTPIPVVTDQRGEVVGVQTAGSTAAAEAVAESRGAEVVGGVDEFDLNQGSGRATLTLGGREVGEVDL